MSIDFRKTAFTATFLASLVSSQVRAQLVYSHELPYSPSGAEGEFNLPNDIDFDSSGTLHVTDSLNRRVQQFHVSGEYVDQYNGFDTALGHMHTPQGMGLAPNGHLLVADTADNCVVEFDEDRAFVRRWESGGLFDNPIDVDVNSIGNMLVLCGPLNNPSLVTLDPEGNWLATNFFGTTGGFFTIAPDDRIYRPLPSIDRVGVLDAAGNSVDTLGENAPDPGDLDDPCGIDVDDNGTVFVTELGNDRVSVFAENGVFLRKWGSPGSGDGQFNDPRGIITGDNTVYVCDSGNNRIQAFDKAGTFLGAWGTKGYRTTFEKAIALSPSASGGVMVATNTTGIPPSVNEFTQWGDPVRNLQFVDNPLNHYTALRGVSLEANGNLLVTGLPASATPTLARFASSGSFMNGVGTSGSTAPAVPAGIAASPDGSVYVGSGGRLARFNSALQFVDVWGTHGTNASFQLYGSLLYIAADSAGNVYISNKASDAVEMFDSAGNHIKDIGATGSGPGQFVDPKGLAVGHDNSLFVVDSGNSRIQKFNSEGTFLWSYGVAGDDPGEFNSPEAIAVTGTAVYVLDTYAPQSRSRIQVFQDQSLTEAEGWQAQGKP